MNVVAFRKRKGEISVSLDPYDMTWTVDHTSEFGDHAALLGRYQTYEAAKAAVHVAAREYHARYCDIEETADCK